MNYKIIFCLLFALINSKKEFNPISEKTTNLLNSDSLGETDYCGGADTKDQCLAITHPKQYYQCCYIITKDGYGNSEKCSEYPKDIEHFKKL